MVKVVAMLGGTFDPIHQGHLHIASQVYEKLHPEQVVFVPNLCSPHRPSPEASAEDRLTMVRLAIQDYPFFDVDDLEMKRSAPSYTIDSLRYWQATTPTVLRWLIVGEDAFSQLLKWQEGDLILHYCHLIVFKRPQGVLHPSEKLQRLCTLQQTQNPEDLYHHPVGKIFFLQAPTVSISASQIREMLHRGEPVDSHFLPAVVSDYIKKKNVYPKI